jgi:ribosomal protein S18 acetylase RimI-like enzyme
MSVETRIRDARHEDAPAVLEVWHLAYGRATGESEADIGRLLATPAARFLLIDGDGVPDATLIVTFDGWRGNMYRLAVRPEMRRRGRSPDACRGSASVAADAGCRRITALVEADHKSATGFWQAAGYTLDEGMSRYYLNLD